MSEILGIIIEFLYAVTKAIGEVGNTMLGVYVFIHSWVIVLKGRKKK